MKFTKPLFFTLSIAVATTGKVLPRGLASSGAEFSSRAYDYIVVGGGTAGLVVAARLSEDPNVSVGVIEAGQYYVNDPIIDTPAAAFQPQGNPKYDWLFKSVPQPHLKDRNIPLARGKALGGSSAINGMIFLRAPEEDYDAWARLGNPGWDWSELSRYMKRAEHFVEVDPFRLNYTNAQADDIWSSQGTEGPIAARYGSWYSDITTPYGKSATKSGIRPNFNPDSGNPSGIYNPAMAVNSTTGKRSYAASTYYVYNAHRPNLAVLTGAQATRIMFKNSTKGKGDDQLTATGVSFVHNSTTFNVSAKREVIISAGTMQTPQLLELSGIGNSTILRQYGITPLCDLPGVGENLQDHLLISTNYELKPGFTTLDTLGNNATFAAAAQAQYETTHDGILTSFGAILSFIGLHDIASPKEVVDLTARFNDEIAAKDITPLQKAQYEIRKEQLDKSVEVEIIFYPVYFGSGAPKANTSYIGILPAGQHPLSRGSIHINSSNPLAPPSIDPNFLSKKYDQDLLVQGIKFCDKIAKTEPLASLIVARESPASSVTSDAGLVDHVRANAQTLNHAIGTAALAPRALGGVVDTNLKVYGTLNLRVIDASIIPMHIGAHASRTVYGIAEKAAEIIKRRK